jgi:hypothetical protein
MPNVSTVAPAGRSTGRVVPAMVAAVCAGVVLIGGSMAADVELLDGTNGDQGAKLIKIEETGGAGLPETPPPSN